MNKRKIMKTVQTKTDQQKLNFAFIILSLTDPIFIVMFSKTWSYDPWGYSVWLFDTISQQSIYGTTKQTQVLVRKEKKKEWTKYYSPVTGVSSLLSSWSCVMSSLSWVMFLLLLFCSTRTLSNFYFLLMIQYSTMFWRWYHCHKVINSNAEFLPFLHTRDEYLTF